MRKIAALIVTFVICSLLFNSCIKPVEPKGSVLIISPSSANVDWDATSVVFTISCNTGWAADMPSVGWASITSGKSGNGDGSIIVTLSPNEDNVTRKVTLTVTSNDVSVEVDITQYYNDAIRLSDTELVFGCNGGNKDFDITAKGGFAQELEGNPDWARIVPYTKSQTVAYTLQIDPNLSGTPRSTAIVVTDSESGFNRKIAVNQEARNLAALDITELGVYDLDSVGTDFATERIGRQILMSESDNSYSVCFMTPSTQNFFELSNIPQDLEEGKIVELSARHNLFPVSADADKRFFLARRQSGKSWLFSFDGYCVIVNG